MASYCPTCRGILRPEKGILVCIRCTRSARSRTVISKGRRIQLQQGQQGLSVPQESEAVAHPTLTPKKPQWEPHGDGKPHPQLGLFPHEEVRSGQKRFLRDVTLAVQQGRHLVAQAPTGIGKTAASLAPALQAAIDQDKTVLFLTSRQSQHRIAVDTLRRIRDDRGARFAVVDLVAKRDMCLRPEAQELHPARFPDFCGRETRNKSCRYLGDVDKRTFARVAGGVYHVEELMQVSKEAELCPHIVAMEVARKAQVVVADYNHLFSDIREQSLERLGLRLSDVIVIVDEAHNLPDRIRQNHSHKITDFLLDQVEAEARGQKHRDVRQDVAALGKTITTLVQRATREGTASRAVARREDTEAANIQIKDLHDTFESHRNKGTLGLHRTLNDVVGDLTALANKVRRGSEDDVHSEELAKTLEDWGRFGDGALRFVEWDEGGASIHLKLLDPGVPASNVYDDVHSAILMSGTLRPPEMLRDILALEEGRTGVRVYANPFPAQNRLTCVAKGVSTRYRDRGPELWQTIARWVAELCGSAKGNVAVFAPSYQILQDVRESMPPIDKEQIVEESGWSKMERDQVLDTLRGAKKRRGALLMGVLGGSFAEGVDYPDNLLSAIVVIGLPLAPPTMEVEAAIGHFERKFPGRGRNYGYVYPAMNKAVQAMGRGIRGPDDKCVVLLLDERYLQRPYRDVLPGDVVASTDPVFTASSFVEAHGL